MTIKIVNSSTVTVSAQLDFETMKTLEQICKVGLPETITPELREAIELLVCGAINPYRHILACISIEGGQDDDRSQ